MDLKERGCDGMEEWIQLAIKGSGSGLLLTW